MNSNFSGHTGPAAATQDSSASIIAFEGDSQVYFFEGSYTEYEENKKMRLLVTRLRNGFDIKRLR